MRLVFVVSQAYPPRIYARSVFHAVKKFAEAKACKKQKSLQQARTVPLPIPKIYPPQRRMPGRPGRLRGLDIGSSLGWPRTSPRPPPHSFLFMRGNLS